MAQEDKAPRDGADETKNADPAQRSIPTRPSLRT
jgi:hypothetical protein